ncbi:TRAP transporter small permease [Falsigemmobacter intermedius]|uniref:TRAP transporter small permease n=1 Tax=Falsigemmobacter intermedius TaxID=1553448 RepID=UPI003F0E9F71
MTRINQFMRRLTDILGWFSALLVVLLILHVGVDVVMRTFFKTPLVGTIEFVSIFYMVGLTFLPLALAERYDTHIIVEVLTELMPKRVVHVLIILATLLIVLICGLLCLRSWQEAWSQYQRGSTVLIAGAGSLVSWPSYFALPVGFAVAALTSLCKFFCLLTGTPFGEPAGLPAGEGSDVRG